MKMEGSESRGTLVASRKMKKHRIRFSPPEAIIPTDSLLSAPVKPMLEF
jgi:hypothetical protein